MITTNYQQKQHKEINPNSRSCQINNKRKRKSKYADLTPEGEDVRLNSAAGWAIIVKPSNPSVDLEGRDVKQTPFEGVNDGLPECLPVAGFLRGVHFSAHRKELRKP